jgi:hypothetical protein
VLEVSFIIKMSSPESPKKIPIQEIESKKI